MSKKFEISVEAVNRLADMNIAKDSEISTVSLGYWLMDDEDNWSWAVLEYDYDGDIVDQTYGDTPDEAILEHYNGKCS